MALKLITLPDKPTLTLEIEGLVSMRWRGLAIWYSYTIPIAFQLKINPPVGRKNEFKVADHYAHIGITRFQTIPGDQFNSRLKNLVEEYWVV